MMAMIAPAEVLMIFAMLGVLVAVGGGAGYAATTWLRRRLQRIDRRLDAVERRQRIEHLTDLVRLGEAAGRLDAEAASRLDAWLDELRQEAGGP